MFIRQDNFTCYASNKTCNQGIVALYSVSRIFLCWATDLQLANDQFASIFTFSLHPLCRKDHKSIQMGVCLGRWMIRQWQIPPLFESRANNQLVDCSCFYENWILRHYHSSTNDWFFLNIMSWKQATDDKRNPNDFYSWLNFLHESVKGPLVTWHKLFIRTKKIC